MTHLRVLLTGGFLLLPLVAALLRPVGSTFTVDEGNKLLLTRAIAMNPLRAELPYLGLDLDPELRWAPIGPPFAYVRDGKFLSQYPPAFAALSVPGLALGYHGIFLLPWFGLVLSVLLAMSLARRCGASPFAAAMLAGPASALYPYGALFWEHTLASAAVAYAMVLVCRATGGRADVSRSFLLAGAALGLGAWLREELVVLLLPLLVLAAGQVGKRGLLPILSFCVAWAPSLLWQAYLTGTPWGLHVANLSAWSGVENLLQERSVVLASLFVASPGSVVPVWVRWIAVVAAVALAFFAWTSRRTVPSARRLLLAAGVAAATAASIGALGSLVQAPSLSRALIQAGGLLLFVPWIGLALGTSLDSVHRRSLGSISAGFDRASSSQEEPDPAAQCLTLVARFGGLGTLLLLLLTPSSAAHGVHWGPRILLSLAPVWAVLAASFRPRGAIERALMIGLALVSTILQIGGLALHGQEVRRIGQMQQRVRSELAALPEDGPVVTHLWWYAQALPDLCASRPMFGVRSRADLEDWLHRFARSRPADGLGPDRPDETGPEVEESPQFRSFAWVTDAPADDILRGLPLRSLGEETIDTPGLEHRILLLELQEPDSPAGRAAEARRRLEESYR